MDSIDETAPVAQVPAPVVALFGDTMTQLNIVLDEMKVYPWATPEKLQKAFEAVLEERVTPTARADFFEVASRDQAKGSYLAHNGLCKCPYGQHHPDERYGCYHPVAAKLYQRWQQNQRPLVAPPLSAPQEMPLESSPNDRKADVLASLRRQIFKQLNTYGFKGHTKADYEDAVMCHTGLVLAPEQFAEISVRLQELLDARLNAPPAPKVLKDYMVDVHGKPYVQYAGLLALAHERGLQSLSARFVSVTETLALGEATAVFADGRTFTDAADATPENVNRGVKAHFARCALTRAKARCLRDALNISEIAAEELEG